LIGNSIRLAPAELYDRHETRCGAIFGKWRILPFAQYRFEKCRHAYSHRQLQSPALAACWCKRACRDDAPRSLTADAMLRDDGRDKPPFVALPNFSFYRYPSYCIWPLHEKPASGKRDRLCTSADCARSLSPDCDPHIPVFLPGMTRSFAWPCRIYASNPGTRAEDHPAFSHNVQIQQGACAPDSVCRPSYYQIQSSSRFLAARGEGRWLGVRPSRCPVFLQCCAGHNNNSDDGEIAWIPATAPDAKAAE